MIDVLPELTLILPELVLVCGAMALLMVGAFAGDRSYHSVSWVSVLVILGAGVAASATTELRTTLFGDQFVVDAFGHFMKWLVFIGSALAIVMSFGYNRREQIGRPEYPILIVFATLGMSMMISANDLIALYVGLELQSLALYVIAAIRRDSARSSEAGLKYFVLGALSSGMLLYGCSMVYGFAGSTGFETLAGLFSRTDAAPEIGVIVGLVFVIAGLAFKISAVPFHMWTPDVYQGAPTPVTAFFAIAPKVAAMALFVRVLVGPFFDLFQQWQQIVVFIAILSMVLGAFAAIWQTNIKRLLAYSSIGHVGFALVGLAAGSTDGVRGIAIYMAVYLVMTAGTFCCVLAMRQNGRMVEDLTDLAGLSRNAPLMALALAIFMFSMAGIPPLAGFFSKLYVFLAAVDAGLYTLAVIGVLTSVVAAFYYLRIVKIMYFDEPAEAFDRPMGRSLAAIVAVSSVLVVAFIAFQTPIVRAAEVAAAVLFFS
ncbi:MAG: NADH-quinone oxidoreductase subunit NuoN [Defluviicoccus sp.]|nr:NADH-quinone oxidoreductase subunit NuoN [Defluviicoccus sp.]MDE0279373.1 NADH-quinone oxidoreductase subunit NuoN [Defluviicoccus sp.]